MEKRSIFVPCAAILALWPGAVAAAAAGWTPTMRQIARLERRILLPGGARRDLAFYDRRYAGVVEHGRPVVIGLLRRLGDASGHAAIIPPSRLPVIADAGCDALTLRYDPAATERPEVACTSWLPSRAPARP